MRSWIRSLFVAVVLASSLSSLGCDGAGEMESAPASAPGTQGALTLQAPLTVNPATLNPSTISTPVFTPAPGGSADLKACTPDDQSTCQQCQDDCQAGICATPKGDKVGGCIGLFCATRCDTCVLACSQVRACVRCFGH